MQVQETVQNKTKPWTFEEAIHLLQANPRDTTLQYIALALATRTKGSKGKENLERVKKLLPTADPARTSDILSIFSGAAAVQESLQLDAPLQFQPPGEQTTQRRAERSKPENPFVNMRTRNHSLSVDLYMRNFDDTVPLFYSGSQDPQVKLWQEWIGSWFSCTSTLWSALASNPGYADLELTLTKEGKIIKADILESMAGAEFAKQIDECLSLLSTHRIFALPEESGETANFRILFGAFQRPKKTDDTNSGIDFHPSKTCTDKATWERSLQERQDRVRRRYAYCLANTTLVDLRPEIKEVEVPAKKPKNKASSGPKSVSDLTGPTIKSHPWTTMLKGRTPAVSRLSRLVPADFFLVESRSVEKLFQAASASSSCKDYILSQFRQQALEKNIVERVQRQLIINAELLETINSSRIEEVCLTGSDLYVADGSDISLLLLADEGLTHDLFRGLSSQVTRSATPIACEYFNYRGVDCVSLTTTDRQICLYSANPKNNVHVRSNSKVALQRILDATIGDAQQLGNQEEFAFVRTIMPWSASDNDAEDVFVYLSDPFIRNLVGPRIRIAQHRRSICQSRLKMIDSAILLYCAEEGIRPSSLDELRRKDCLPSTPLECPDAGSYSMSEAKEHGVCTVHGTMQFQTPCIEVPIDYITAQEFESYRTFVNEYSRYWRTYFDPIGIQIGMKEREYRVKTIVLPLIDNTVYRSLSMVLGGSPERLDTLTTSDDTILSTTLRLNKETLMSMAKPFSPIIGSQLGSSLYETINSLLAQGLGNQMSFHACDAYPTFSLDLPMLMGMSLAGAQNNQRASFAPPIWMAVVAASLQMPVYTAFSVKDIELVDSHLETIAKLLTEKSSASSVFDFSTLDLGPGRSAFMIAAVLGPVKLRFFIERIGDAVYAATKPQILDLLFEAKQSKETKSMTEEAHALLAITPSNWQATKGDMCIAWRERSRQACRTNLGHLTAFARAASAISTDSVLPGDLAERARSNGDRACPERGIYSYDIETGQVFCSVHGSSLLQKQSGYKLGADERIPLFDVDRVHAALTFIEHGLQAEFVLKLTS